MRKSRSARITTHRQRRKRRRRVWKRLWITLLLVFFLTAILVILSGVGAEKKPIPTPPTTVTTERTVK